MAERKNAWDNILEDFGWIWGQGDAPLTREQLSIPNVLPDPPSSPLPPAPPVEFLSPQKRANASRDRRVEKPDAQTRMAGIGPAPLEAEYPNLPFGLAISPDMPIATVPPGTGEMAYGISPDISKDTLDKAVADLQSGDRTRKGGSKDKSVFETVEDNPWSRVPREAPDRRLRPSPTPVEEDGLSAYETGQAIRALPEAAITKITGGAESVDDWLTKKKEESITRQDRQDMDAVHLPILEGLKGNADPALNDFGGQIGGLENAPDDPYWLPPGVEAEEKISPNPQNPTPDPFTQGVDAVPLFPEMPEKSDPARTPKADEKPGSSINDTGGGKSGPIASGLKEDADEAEKELNWLQRQARDRFGMDDDQRSDLARALIQGGAATMMGSSPHALQNIGAGIMEGADTYYQEGDDRRTEAIQDEALQMKREAAARQAEAHGLNMEKARAELKKAAEGAGIVSPTGDYGEFDQNVRAMMQRYPNMTITEAQQYVLQRMTDIHKATADSDI